MDDLKELRKKLDSVDEELVRTLAKRLALVREISKVKEARRESLRDLKREQEVLRHIEEAAQKNNLSPAFVKKLFREVMQYSLQEEAKHLETTALSIPKECLVAFQGVENAYSHLALQHYFGEQGIKPKGVSCRTFREAVGKLLSQEVEYAFLPIENTTAGSINEVYHFLLEAPLFIVGEEIWKVEHCLIACQEIPLTEIKKIFSHPRAIDQCSDFLASLPQASVESYFDTAGAVEKIAKEANPNQAAIGPLEAAEALGLVVLKRNIANQEENYTRFVVLSRTPASYDERIPCKTSLILSTRHEKGALMNCLEVLSAHNLNMTKLESRPRPHHPWEYLFYIDFEGNVASKNVASALEQLKATAIFVKVLGSYPAKALPKEVFAPQPNAWMQEEPKPNKVEEKVEGEKPKAPIVVKSKNYKLVSRDYRAEDTLVRVGELLIGGKGFVVMAGPCSVESREQIMQTARHVKSCGAHVLRGGVFKPRTSPYSFQGLEWEGLGLLFEAGKEYGLPIITEVLAPEQVRGIAEKADILQIGARNMQNFPLLREVGKINKPVLLKRGLSSTLEELLSSAEYILSQGNGQVILCERGIRTFETATRNTLDLSAVPVLLERTHLPVIVDPSHGTGNRRYVEPMALAARAVGAHGLLIEVHPQPEKALSDGDQSITFEQFSRLMQKLQTLKV
jgi:chorismate mutase/prephenate dehydratase